MSHIQYFMHASNNDLINWEDLTHDHMTQYFWVPFANYMSKYSRNKTKIKYDDGNSSALKRSTKTLKEKDTFLCQGFIPKLCKFKNGYFLETFGQSEINQ